jgi:hypothetical protein
MRLYGAVALAILVALGAGWLWGRSGRAELEATRRAAIERADLAEARAFVLDGRIHLFQLNYGEAAKRFGEAQTTVERAQAFLRDAGQADRATALDTAIAALKDAQRLSLGVDQGAHSKADEAMRAMKN